MTLVRRDILSRVLKQGLPLRQAADRGTGRTTAIILSAIAAAVARPGVEVVFTDHQHSTDQGVDIRTLTANADWLRKETEHIAFTRLGLREIKTRRLRHPQFHDFQAVGITSNFAESI